MHLTLVVVCGQVLETWPNMFRILGLFCTCTEFIVLYAVQRAAVTVASREKSSELNDQGNEEPAGERLVRVPIEELQTSET